MEAKPRVLVVGAGFVGLYATKALRNAAVEVLMVDQNNYHTFQPLLYQVATAGLEVGDVAQQVRDVFRNQDNFSFRQGTVVGVDWDAQSVAPGGRRAPPVRLPRFGCGRGLQRLRGAGRRGAQLYAQEFDRGRQHPRARVGAVRAGERAPRSCSSRACSTSSSSGRDRPAWRWPGPWSSCSTTRSKKTIPTWTCPRLK